MKVTIVPIVIGAFGTITKGLSKCLEDLEVGGWVETIQMTALLGTARILRRVLEIWGHSLSLKLQWKPSANTYVRNSKGVNNNNNNDNNNNMDSKQQDPNIIIDTLKNKNNLTELNRKVITIERTYTQTRQNIY